MFWFDSHAHLHDEDFAGDWRAVLDRAAEQQVGRILLPGADLADSVRAIDLARQDARFCCSVGCHPHAASGFGTDGVTVLRQMIREHRGNPVVAIGEAGLDYHYDLSPRPIQQEVFRAQIELAQECDLPLIVHEREATADCLRILQAAAADGCLRGVPGVFHCFSGSPETAEFLLEMGFYIGVDGPLTFKNARKLPEVVRICPPERLLLETDSPYLTPVPHRGQRNEPAFLPLIGERVAEIWQMPLPAVALTTARNACRLFNLPWPSDMALDATGCRLGPDCPVFS